MHIPRNDIVNNVLHVRVDHVDAWFAPALRGSIMKDVRVDTEAWDHGNLPAEFRWERATLLPLVGQTPAKVFLRASNSLFSCKMTGDNYRVSILFDALTHRDNFRDPLLPAACMSRYDINMGLRDGTIFMTMEPAREGEWTLDACCAENGEGTSKMEFSATSASATTSLNRWKSSVGHNKLTNVISEVVWRFKDRLNTNTCAACGRCSSRAQYLSVVTPATVPTTVHALVTGSKHYLRVPSGRVPHAQVQQSVVPLPGSAHAMPLLQMPPLSL